MKRGFGSGQSLFILQGRLFDINVVSPNSEIDVSGIELKTFITNVTVTLIKRLRLGLKKHLKGKIAKVTKKRKKATVR